MNTQYLFSCFRGSYTDIKIGGDSPAVHKKHFLSFFQLFRNINNAA